MNIDYKIAYDAAHKVLHSKGINGEVEIVRVRADEPRYFALNVICESEKDNFILTLHGLDPLLDEMDEAIERAFQNNEHSV